MESIKIKHGKKVISADQLYTPTAYGKLKNLSVPRVRYNMLAGNIPSVQIHGILLAILED